MDRLIFHHHSVILDADCAINLTASGQLSPILVSLPCSCAISQYVYSQEIIRNNPQLCVDNGVLQVVQPEEEEYDTIVHINFEVNRSYLQLQDGEIETGAIAIHRNWAIGIDDRRARNYFSDKYPQLQLITTPELLKHWVDETTPTHYDVKLALSCIEGEGNYHISKKHPLYQWWHSWLR